MSRIWDALKEAQKLNSRANNRDDFSVSPNDKPERRSNKRSFHRVPLLIYGSDADKQPFHEEVYTVEVSGNGCLFSLANAVAPGQRLVITNMRNMAEQECRVIHVGKRTQGRTRIGVKFLGETQGFWYSD